MSNKVSYFSEFKMRFESKPFENRADWIEKTIGLRKKCFEMEWGKQVNQADRN